MQNILQEQNKLWDYSIAQKLGKGQYGQVYKVIHKETNKVYALKKIIVSNKQTKQKVQEFQQVKCLKLLSHPSIIRYQESFLSKDNMYVVMQYAQKGDFSKVLFGFIVTMFQILAQRKRKQNFYSENQLWKMFLQIVQGVKYLHSKQIVHRDLKVENIFMMKNGSIKIGDLGISKMLHKQDQLISTRVGTPIYFAPEMIKNQMYSFAVDIWALGCVFYYMTMLQHPYEGATIATLPYFVIDKDLKPIKGPYSPQLIEFIHIFFQKDPKKRLNIFQLAVKLKSRNSSVQLIKQDKVSIFNSRQISNILSVHKRQVQKQSSKRYCKSLERSKPYSKVQQEKTFQQYDGDTMKRPVSRAMTVDSFPKNQSHDHYKNQKIFINSQRIINNVQQPKSIKQQSNYWDSYRSLKKSKDLLHSGGQSTVMINSSRNRITPQWDSNTNIKRKTYSAVAKQVDLMKFHKTTNNVNNEEVKQFENGNGKSSASPIKSMGFSLKLCNGQSPRKVQQNRQSLCLKQLTSRIEFFGEKQKKNLEIESNNTSPSRHHRMRRSFRFG